MVNANKKLNSVNMYLFTRIIMCPAYSIDSPLSQRQKTVWSLVNLGLSISAIAKKLNTTRQYVNQTKLKAETKISTTLLDIAKANDLQIIRVYPKKAILLGYHPALNRKVIITYTTRYGIKVWYWHDKPEEITNKTFLNNTQKYLLDIVKEQNIKIEEPTDIHPAKLAHIIFSKLIPEVKS
jgi:DNA-binding CsgD family transcriptional regulator